MGQYEVGLGILVRTVFAAKRQIENPDKIYLGHFINLPVDSRYSVSFPSGPALRRVFGKSAVASMVIPSTLPLHRQSNCGP